MCCILHQCLTASVSMCPSCIIACSINDADFLHLASIMSVSQSSSLCPICLYPMHHVSIAFIICHLCLAIRMYDACHGCIEVLLDAGLGCNIASTTRIHHLHRINDSHSSSTSHQRLAFIIYISSTSHLMHVT